MSYSRQRDRDALDYGVAGAGGLAGGYAGAKVPVMIENRRRRGQAADAAAKRYLAAGGPTSRAGVEKVRVRARDAANAKNLTILDDLGRTVNSVRAGAGKVYRDAMGGTRTRTGDSAGFVGRKESRIRLASEADRLRPTVRESMALVDNPKPVPFKKSQRVNKVKKLAAKGSYVGSNMSTTYGGQRKVSKALGGTLRGASRLALIPAGVVGGAMLTDSVNRRLRGY